MRTHLPEKPVPITSLTFLLMMITQSSDGAIMRPVHLLLILMVTLPAAGCKEEVVAPAPRSIEQDPLTSARLLLQQSRPQEVVDSLANNEAAAAHYLKSVAFIQLRKISSAAVEIEAAVKADPETEKYRAYQAVVEIFQKQWDSADELIRLYEQHKTSAFFSFTAFYAYQAKRIASLMSKDTQTAELYHQEGIKALEIAIDHCAETPELQRSMLNQALRLKLKKPVRALAERLRKVAPDDPELAEQEIETNLLLGEEDQAIQKAEEHYLAKQKSSEAAWIFAQAIMATPPNSKRILKLKELAEDHSSHLGIATIFATYLAKSDHLPDAMIFLAHAIKQQTQPDAQQQLMRVAIVLCLDLKSAPLAKQQLELYGKQLNEKALLMYFEGRLLHIQNQPQKALNKLNEVIQHQKTQSNPSTELTVETLTWMKQILTEMGVSQQIDKTSKALDSLNIRTPLPRKTEKSQPESSESNSSNGSENQTAKKKANEEPNNKESPK